MTQEAGGRPRSGGQILIDQLQLHGVRQVFCVPGESYLDALNALYDSPIETIICRQEGGAAMMAEAQGKLTGRPGICFVTRGPGITNASAAVHIAEAYARGDLPVQAVAGVEEQLSAAWERIALAARPVEVAS